MEPRVEGFEVVAPLGTGAMSSVWRARDLRSGRSVALKILHPHVALSGDAVDRFLHEVRAYERLSHPNIIACLGHGQTGDSWYVALELLDGGDLRAVLRAAGRLPPEVAAFALGEVLAALAHAHRVGVVHRDVKPENVMVAADGSLKLVDFGISKALDFTRLTEAGTILGTPAYMAPEQADSGEATPRSDLWSAGVLLYEMVTGQNPFAADHAAATLLRLRTRTPAPLGYLVPAVPEGLEDIAARLLQRDSALRPERAEDVLDALAPVVAAGGAFAARETFRALVADPAGIRQEWIRPRREARLRLARELGPRDPQAAYLEASEALAIDPASAAAAALVAELAPRIGVRLPLAPSPRALELEREAEEYPSNLLALVNLVRVARGDGDLLRAARAYRWGRRRSLRDRFAAMQLATALGFELAAHVEGIAPERLRARLQGRGGAATAAGRVGRSLLASRLLWLTLALLAGIVVWGRMSAPVDAGAAATAPHRPRLPVRPADAGSIFLDKAAALAAAGDAERALEVHQRFLRTYPQHPRLSEALFRAAESLEQLGRDDDARRRFAEVFARFPESDLAPAARLRLVLSLERAGRFDEAQAALAPALAAGDPEDRAAAALIEGRLLEKRGETDAAIALYDRLLAGPPPGASLLARARLGRARALVARADPAAAAAIDLAAEGQAPGSSVAKEVERLRERLRNGG